MNAQEYSTAVADAMAIFAQQRGVGQRVAKTATKQVINLGTPLTVQMAADNDGWAARAEFQGIEAAAFLTVSGPAAEFPPEAVALLPSFLAAIHDIAVNIDDADAVPISEYLVSGMVLCREPDGREHTDSMSLCIWARGIETAKTNALSIITEKIAPGALHWVGDVEVLHFPD